MPRPKTPEISVDVICELDDKGIVLIERKFEPYGWAIPGGFVDIGETLEQTAVRESKEEFGLDIELVRQFHVYSEPSRDPRGHTVTLVFLAKASGTPVADDDAKSVGVFSRSTLPENIAFDHLQVLTDYFEKRY